MDASKPVMLRMCAWCKKFLDVSSQAAYDAMQTLARLHARDPKNAAAPPKPAITHGICADCKYEQLQSVRDLPTTEPCPHGRQRHEWCESCEAEV